ncbi:feline leukemia virus subgroup C receptor-related protein 2-like protein [Dinothrombium tinctorium]|uniref:Feline leukemia virus subgroup C receptor-related protein 2-like protein n=1 Tax=Dinothrombium tinctorium TaxID=1965070 RepID=A0A3S3PEE1_9ACAR|nr:feline leukemia virus subgroup C receptor-related protein 2-like protein [Dinothrombium tinctorium]
MEITNENIVVFRTYRKRFLICAVLLLCTLTTAFQINQYTSITNVIAEYYQVSSIAVNWTALLNNISTILFAYSLGKFVERYGVRKSMLVITFLLAISAVLKCFASDKNHFWLLMIAQFIPDACFSVILAIAPLIGSIWFKPNEVALVLGASSAIGLFGFALSFITAGLFFTSTKTDDIKLNLFYVSLSLAVLMVLAFFVTLIYMSDKPPTPPSLAEERRSTIRTPTFKGLFTNKNFLLLFTVFVFVNSASQLITVTINQSVTSKFRNSNGVSAVAGFLSLISGIPGSLIIGMITQSNSKYKLSLIIFLSSNAIWTLYISTFSYGMVSNAAYVLALDFIVELSFPFPESLSNSMVQAVSSIPNLICVPLFTKLCEKYGAVEANYILILMGILSLISALFVREDLRRRKADAETTPLIEV